MAGRGKGKSGMSFTMEQLGLSKGELLSTPVLQPPPIYPMLDHKPLPIQMTTEMSYLVGLKRVFTEDMRESSYNVQAVVLKKDIERYCEYYEEAVTTYNTSEYESKYDWSRMPTELKSSRKRKIQQQKPNKKKKIVKFDIEKKLMELEKEENKLDTEEEVEEEEEEEDEEDEMNERVKDEEEVDEEMDAGTDYVNNFFDTGENYYSEDDNDDGPFF